MGHSIHSYGVISVNNLIYVVILSAAVDLVGAKVPKLIAQAETISVRLLGVMMASLSSGLGELTFLMLSSFYRLEMVSAWSSGTGGAGLLGALLFLTLTSWLRLSVPQTLAVVSLFPVLLLIAYFVILTNATSPASRQQAAGARYRPLATSNPIFTINNNEERLLSTTDHHQSPRAPNWDPSSAYLAPQFAKPTSPPSLHSMNGVMDDTGASRFDQQQDQHGNGSSNTQTEGSTLPTSSGRTSPPSIVPTNDNSSASSASFSMPLAVPPWDLTPPSWDAFQHRAEPTSINTLLAATDPDDPNFVSPFRESEESGSGRRMAVYKPQPNEEMTMQEKRVMARSLLVPFMLPLFLVYFAEYTMNQGVLPVVLFPLEKTPFTHMRDILSMTPEEKSLLWELSVLRMGLEYYWLGLPVCGLNQLCVDGKSRNEASTSTVRLLHTYRRLSFLSEPAQRAFLRHSRYVRSRQTRFFRPIKALLEAPDLCLETIDILNNNLHSDVIDPCMSADSEALLIALLKKSPHLRTLRIKRSPKVSLPLLNIIATVLPRFRLLSLFCPQGMPWVSPATMKAFLEACSPETEQLSAWVIVEEDNEEQVESPLWELKDKDKHACEIERKHHQCFISDGHDSVSDHSSQKSPPSHPALHMLCLSGYFYDHEEDVVMPFLRGCKNLQMIESPRRVPKRQVLDHRQLSDTSCD
ncbi:battenin CLN3 protein [Linnemannia hyalina]|uniref:Battenin CLN3 protein n=1 Tax=Linnemannia hyalina TaxID=64524 RepID=A0A9P8BNA1_9FUNG|nr:battenin CLN3 protein [Linnemannia hyalina]